MAIPRSAHVWDVCDRLMKAGYSARDTGKLTRRLNRLSAGTLTAAVVCMDRHVGAEMENPAAFVFRNLLASPHRVTEGELGVVMATYDPNDHPLPHDAALELARGLVAYRLLLPGFAATGRLEGHEVEAAGALVLVGGAAMDACHETCICRSPAGAVWLRDQQLAELVASDPARAGQTAVLVRERRRASSDILAAALIGPSALAAGAL